MDIRKLILDAFSSDDNSDDDTNTDIEETSPRKYLLEKVPNGKQSITDQGKEYFSENLTVQDILDVFAGLIDKNKEPFSIRKKEFWDVSEAYKLMSDDFKNQLAHEPDGLIFQPSRDPYKSGREDSVLKWKPAEMNSVDFKLKIVKESGAGIVPRTIGQLFVGGMDQPFGQMKVKGEVKEMNNKIIECKWDNNQWVFMRERTDKSFPNGYNTAMGVIQSIREPVTTDILLNFIDYHRWKETDQDLMPPPPKVRKL